MNDSEVCVECGVSFDPLPWADPSDFICDECVEAQLLADEQNPWR